MWVPEVNKDNLINLDMCDRVYIDHGIYGNKMGSVKTHIHRMSDNSEIFRGSMDECREYLNKLLKIIGME